MTKISNIYSKALVTGASRGLGRAFTDMLLDEGVEVWGTSRNLNHLTKRDGFHPLELDLSCNESLTQVIENTQTEGIDLLINNAGSGTFARFEDFPYPLSVKPYPGAQAVHLQHSLGN